MSLDDPEVGFGGLVDAVMLLDLPADDQDPGGQEEGGKDGAAAG